MALARPTPSRRTLTLIVVPLIALVAAGWIGDALLPQLIPDHPLVFIALNARNRNLALATNLLDPVSYYVVGSLRLLVSDPLFYLLGFLYGDAAVRWIERRSPTYGSLLRSAERVFGTAAYPLVAIAPNSYICLFAGSSGMHPAAFAILNVGGTVARLYAIRRFGEAFSSPIGDLLDFIQEYRTPLLVVSVMLVGLTVLYEMRRGTSEIDSLRRLEEEMAEAEDELGAELEQDELVDAALKVEVPASAAAAGASTPPPPPRPSLARRLWSALVGRRRR